MNDYDELYEDNKELKRRLEILEAGNINRLTEAYRKIDKCTIKNYMASGVTLTIKNINKKNFTICDEFMIGDGLSDETIEAIKKDIKRAYDLKLPYIAKL